MLEQSERDEKIMSCTMASNYAESYLESLSDKELLEVYERIMDKGMKSDGKHY